MEVTYTFITFSSSLHPKQLQPIILLLIVICLLFSVRIFTRYTGFASFFFDLTRAFRFLATPPIIALWARSSRLRTPPLSRQSKQLDDPHRRLQVISKLIAFSLADRGCSSWPTRSLLFPLPTRSLRYPWSIACSCRTLACAYLSASSELFAFPPGRSARCFSPWPRRSLLFPLAETLVAFPPGR